MGGRQCVYDAVDRLAALDRAGRGGADLTVDGRAAGMAGECAPGCAECGGERAGGGCTVWGRDLAESRRDGSGAARPVWHRGGAAQRDVCRRSGRDLARLAGCDGARGFSR